MDVSLASRLNFPCPKCGKSLSTEVWVIVDAVERPDLVRRIRDQTSLHAFLCPLCSYQGQVETPLLIYRRGETPPLLFSPARGTTEEHNLQQVAGLVDLLRSQLGGEWREEWLAAGLPVVPRQLLAEVLAGHETAQWQTVGKGKEKIAMPFDGQGEQEREMQESPAANPQRRSWRDLLAEAGDLGQWLLEFCSAPSVDERRRALEVHLELLTAGSDHLLGQLAAAARGEGDALSAQLFLGNQIFLRRCCEVGISAAWAEVMQAAGKWLDVPPHLQTVLLDLARLTHVTDMPQRAEVCRRALAQVERERHPWLWAVLQGELAYSLALDPGTDRAENLERAIAACEQALQTFTHETHPVEWAGIVMNLSHIYAERIRGDRAENLERAIAACEQALQVFTREAHPIEWAATMDNLASAYKNRVRGDHAGNLERAIEGYEQALQVRTRDELPLEWAQTMGNLANTYSERIRGNRGENLERAIAGYEQALQVLPRRAFPELWAHTIHNLAITYHVRIRGDRAENQERAIAYCEQALQIRTRDAFPEQWAITMVSIANAYSDRICGDFAENIEQAIAAYEQALQVLTRDAFPETWAQVQHNLAGAYYYRVRGDRAENLERSIAACDQALQVQTRDALPIQWATTMLNLANGYQNRILGDRAENLEQAIVAHEQALQVLTRDTLPVEWAQSTMNLANVYSMRVRGDRAENIERAIEGFKQALQVRARDAAPLEWAEAMDNLASAYFTRIRGDRAENLEQAIAGYTQALGVCTRDAAPLEWARIIDNLASAYFTRIRGERAENLERAIEIYEQVLQACARNALPIQWATTMMHLGATYYSRIRGDRAENLERAITTYEQALQVLTRDALPVEWASTMSNLAAAYFSRIRGNRAENIERSIAALEQILQVRKLELLPADHLETQRALGLACFTAGRWQEATTAYEGAQAASKLLYEAAATPEARQAELREVQGTAQLLAYALVKACEPGVPANLEKAVAVLESGRARWLSEALIRVEKRPAAVPENVWSCFIMQRDEISQLEAESRLPEGMPGKRDFITLSSVLGSARARLGTYIATIRTYEPDFMPEPSFANIQSTAVATPLIYLIVTPHGGLALVVHTGGIETTWFDLTKQELESLLVTRKGDTVIGGYLPDLFSFNGPQKALTEILPLLGERVMDPLAAVLRRLGATTVTLIPTGLFSLLPLHAARYTEGEREICFLEEFTVAFAPSAWVLASARRAVLTRPLFPVRLVGAANSQPDSQPLLFSQIELEEIAALLPPGTAHLLCGPAVTRTNLLQHLPGATITHLGIHSGFNPWSPLDSVLLLTGQDRLLLRDVLSPEFATLNSTGLAVLSSCQTSLTDYANLPDEVMGLASGFLHAGVPTVVASLWPVDDLATSLLMRRFYEGLLGERLSPAAALRQAQLWLRGVTVGEVRVRLEVALAQLRVEAKERKESLRRKDSEGALRRWSSVVDAQAKLESLMRLPEDESLFADPAFWAAFQAVGAN